MTDQVLARAFSRPEPKPLGRPLPWSWLALALTIMPLGGLLILQVYFVQIFRQGLDADMQMSMENMPLHELVASMALVGVVGLVVVLLGWGLTRLARGGERMFVTLVAGVPGALLALSMGWYIGKAMLTPPDGLYPFEAENLFYLPNWLQLVLFPAAFGIAAWTYVRVARVAVAIRKSR
ncbi:Zn-dependent protease with chaperone function [Caulobacter ginsengisoli]|uniref:Zn-dependent protease with chaperone function n=1 Tax=Caulobacter ginsengisoli TaxID=400775 RepID=A0ABU0IMP5_9CAUL|nr:hypothetical protein [Caulobacter ginsengisoli]MDQ0463234.1 Zn-dependent protease with chaperone function [Caulobacter ginsengisoli]